MSGLYWSSLSDFYSFVLFMASTDRSPTTRVPRRPSCDDGVVWSVSTSAYATVVLCVTVAAFEEWCAGKNVRTFFETLRFPRYSAPLWLWSIIGVMYYGIFGFVAFRLLSAVPPSFFAGTTLALTVTMMVGNALTNLVIFRARNLHLSCLIGYVFAGLDVVLAMCVLRLDGVAAGGTRAVSPVSGLCGVVGTDVDQAESMRAERLGNRR